MYSYSLIIIYCFLSLSNLNCCLSTFDYLGVFDYIVLRKLKLKTRLMGFDFWNTPQDLLLHRLCMLVLRPLLSIFLPHILHGDLSSKSLTGLRPTKIEKLIVVTGYLFGNVFGMNNVLWQRRFLDFLLSLSILISWWRKHGALFQMNGTCTHGDLYSTEIYSFGMKS